MRPARLRSCRRFAAGGVVALFCFSIAAIMPAYSRSASSAPTIIPGTPVNSACTIRLSCTCSLLRQSCRLQSGSRRRGHFNALFKLGDVGLGILPSTQLTISPPEGGSRQCARGEKPLSRAVLLYRRGLFDRRLNERLTRIFPTARFTSSEIIIIFSGGIL